jgi:hypothetical protein
LKREKGNTLSNKGGRRRKRKNVNERNKYEWKLENRKTKRTKKERAYIRECHTYTSNFLIYSIRSQMS